MSNHPYTWRIIDPLGVTFNQSLTGKVSNVAEPAKIQLIAERGAHVYGNNPGFILVERTIPRGGVAFYSRRTNIKYKVHYRETTIKYCIGYELDGLRHISSVDPASGVLDHWTESI